MKGHEETVQSLCLGGEELLGLCTGCLISPERGPPSIFSVCFLPGRDFTWLPLTHQVLKIRDQYFMF